MKIIFLDVDGVLNTVRDYRLFGHGYINKDRVALLAHVVERTAGKIVLASNWRLLDRDQRLVEDALSLHNLEIFDVTPTLEPEVDGEHVFRHKEIQRWLDTHTPDKFAILDDDSRANIDGSFFQTDETIGLTHEIANQVIAHLT
ncbi:HAD domain-containing protein [bacterium]|nr:HAD domain-containing protein [bacterium]